MVYWTNAVLAQDIHPLLEAGFEAFTRRQRDNSTVRLTPTKEIHSVVGVGHRLDRKIRLVQRVVYYQMRAFGCALIAYPDTTLGPHNIPMPVIPLEAGVQKIVWRQRLLGREVLLWRQLPGRA